MTWILCVCTAMVFYGTGALAKMRLPPIGVFDDVDVPKPYVGDSLKTPGENRTPFRRGNLRGTDLTVDTLVLLDYGIFQAFSKNFKDVPEKSRNDEIVSYLRQYYGMTFAAVAQRYDEANFKVDGKDGKIRLRLAAIHMATTPEEDEWSEPHTEETGSWRKKIKDTGILTGVADWFEKKRAAGEYKNVDHVLLFTGHDIMTIGNDYDTGAVGVYVNYAVGVAYRSQICKRLTVTATEEDLQFKSISTAAHELGHNLGADHDGDGEGASCPATDEYLMNGGVTRGTKHTFQNMYKFSSCSENSFRNVVKSLNDEGNNCMAETGEQDPEMKKLSDVIPGFLFDLHQQCKIFMRSKDSYYCGQNSNEAMKDICRKPKCWNPRGKFCGDFAGVNHVLPGTPCGSDKWCMNGACVKTEKKISLNENGCILEDSPKCDNYEPYKCRIWPDGCCNKCKQMNGK